MSRLPEPGGDDGLWGDILNDFLAVSHLDDGRIRVSALPEPQVADGSITPAKLSQPYVPTSSKGKANGVASLDATAKIPASQLPSGFLGADATTTTKGVVQLSGDLGGTAAAPTVPALADKYEKPASGIPESDLDSAVQTKLNSGGTMSDATTTTKGAVQLAGDLGGTAAAPTVPGLANKINTSARGAANGVAALDGTGRVPTSQLPAGLEPDATTTTKGIVQLAGDLGGTAAAPTVPGLALKADNDDVMHLTGNETVTGVKVFTSSIEVPDPENDLDTANKRYVDGLVAGGAPDATTTTKGIVQLAGDLGGTAAAPTVPGLTDKVDVSELGVADGVATLDSSGKLTAAQARSTGQIHTFSSTGTLATTSGQHRLYNDSAGAWTIAGIRASVGSTPAGSSILIDVNVNGTTIFTTQANRPAIAAGANTSGKVTNMDVTSVAVGQYLTIDIDQVGSGTAGSDLTVQVEVS